MVGFYEGLQTVATDLLTKFKQGVIQYVKITPGNGPAHNPGPSMPTTYTLAGAVARGPQFKYLSTGFAVASDKQVNSAVDARFTPDKSGRMIIDGVEYKIKNWKPIPSAGVPVAWVFICER